MRMESQDIIFNIKCNTGAGRHLGVRVQPDIPAFQRITIKPCILDQERSHPLVSQLTSQQLLTVNKQRNQQSDSCNVQDIAVYVGLLLIHTGGNSELLRGIPQDQEYCKVVQFCNVLLFQRIRQGIQYKLGLLVYKCLRGDAPSYLADMISPVGTR